MCDINGEMFYGESFFSGKNLILSSIILASMVCGNADTVVFFHSPRTMHSIVSADSADALLTHSRSRCIPVQEVIL